jgi:ketosteroid isomerase-like protein
VWLPAAAIAALSAGLACSSGPTFEPIVLDLSHAKTPVPEATPAAAAATPVPAAPVPPVAAQASVPAADLTPPPRERPEPPPTPVPAPGPDSPTALIARQRQALDRGDVDGAIAMWAPDAKVDSGDGSGPRAGKDAVRTLLSSLARSSGNVERIESGAYVSERSSAGLVVWEVREGRIVSARVYR